MEPLPRLLAVTAATDLGELEATLAAAPGDVAIQLRDPGATAAAIERRAAVAAPLCRRAGAPLFINRHVEVARALGAGLHLPERMAGELEWLRRRLAPDAAIGVSTHGAAAAAKAAKRASYVVLGPIWATPGKDRPLGIEALERAAAGAGGAPIFAIGGIDSPERALAALAAGAHGVAGIRAFAGDRIAALAAALPLSA